MRVVFILALLFSSCLAQIVPVHSMEEAMDHFKGGDQSTLGVFDIDMVLIQPSEPAFQLVNIQKFAPIAKQIILSVPQDKRPILYTLTAYGYESILVQENIPCYLQDLCDRGIPTVALTASLTGSLLDIPSLEMWKVDHLLGVGINFACGAPYDHPILFCQLPTYRGNHAVFTRGILFTNGEKMTKGELLVAFLKTAHLCPREIIFADDKLANVESVETALAAYDPSIRFVGLHFLAALKYPSTLLSEQEFTARWEAVAEQAKSLD